MSETEDVLGERGRTHGYWPFTARTSQALKRMAQSGIRWGDLTPGQREALEMALMKVARIVEGGGDTREHWKDAIGYLTLGMQDAGAEVAPVVSSPPPPEVAK